MSLSQYTYNNDTYFFNPEKINMITISSDKIFSFLFDDQKSISIVFKDYDAGVLWVNENIITPSLAGDCECP